jgi:hypothetical protein
MEHTRKGRNSAASSPWNDTDLSCFGDIAIERKEEKRTTRITLARINSTWKIISKIKQIWMILHLKCIWRLAKDNYISMEIITGGHVASAQHRREDIWVCCWATVGIIASRVVHNWDVDAAELVGNDTTKLKEILYSPNLIRIKSADVIRVRYLTVVVPHPETVSMSPEGGSNSSVGGGNKIGWTEGTLRSNGDSN